MTDTTILEELSEPYLEPDEGAPSVPDEGVPSGSTSTVSDPEEPTDAEPARSNPYKAVEYTPEAIKSLYNIYGSDIEQGLAKQVLNELNLSPQFKGTANYDDVVSGRAKILDMLPIEDSEGFQGKGLSDDQIIRLFSSLRTLGEDGAPTEIDAFLRGLTRGGTNLAAGIAGAKALARVAPPYVPLPGPLAPLGVLSKPVAGLLGFAGGMVLSDAFVGEKLADAVAENPELGLLTPRAERAFRSYEAGGNVAPFILFPFLAPKAVLNTAHYVKNLPVANQATVITAEAAQNPLIQRYLSGKLANSPNRVMMHQRRNEIFAAAKKAGNPISLKEAAKLAEKEVPTMGFVIRNSIRGVDYVENALVGGGQSVRNMGIVGKAATLGVESLAVPATMGLTYLSEESFPRSKGARVAAETIGSLAPTLTILKHVPKIFSALSNKRTSMAESRAMGDGLDLFGIKGRARNRAIDDIFDVLEANREDPEALLENLETLLVDPVLGDDGEIIGYNLKKEILDSVSAGEINGDGAVFSSQYMDSAALTQLENAVMSRSGQRGALDQARQASFNKSQEIQRGLIYALRGTGDSELVKLAADMMQDRISLLIGNRMETAVQRNIDAIQRIYPEGGPEARRLLGERMSNTVREQEKLFRALERRAWAQVDQKQPLEKFYRKDPDTGELVENPVPNIFEEWDAIVDGLDPLQRDILTSRVPEFRDLNKRVLDLKNQLGLSSVNKLDGTLDETAKFRASFDGMEGRPARDLYERTYNRIASEVLGDQPFDEANLSEEATNALIEAFGKQEARMLGKISSGSRETKNAANLLGLKRQELIARKRELVSGEASGVVSEPLTVQNVVAIYSEMRNLGRRVSETDPNWSRLATSMAEAALEDLNGMPQGRGVYDAARDMSFAFNEYLRRAFPGEIMRTTPRGKRVVDPGLVTAKFMTGKPDAVAIRLDQIQDLNTEILNRLDETGFPISVEVFDTVTDANGAVRQVRREIEMERPDVLNQIGNADETMQNMLRLAIRDVTAKSSTNRRLSPLEASINQDKALSRWKEEYAQMLDAFPAVRTMVDEADSAADFVMKAERIVGRLGDRVQQAKAYQALIGHENPTKAVEAAFGSKNPKKELDSLVEIVNAAADPSRRSKYNGRIDFSQIDPEEVQAGLRMAVMDFAFTRGGKGSEDAFSASAVYNTVFDKIPNASGDTNTLGNWMLRNDLINEAQLNAMQQGLRTMVAAEGRKLAGDVVFTDDAPLLLDFYTRLAGARLGTEIAGFMGGRSSSGAGMIEAQAGSKLLRKLTQELPALQEYDALEQILLDPEMLAVALRKGRSRESKAGALNFILRRLKKLGIGAAIPGPQRAIPLGVMEYGEEEPEALSAPAPAPAPAVIDEIQGEPDDLSFVRPPAAPAPDQRSSVRPPAVPTRSVAAAQQPPIPPRPAPTPAPQSVASAPTQAPASPETRQRYAALFPNDPASSMIRSQQGIGGLLG